jgi:hypothetical protein
MPVPALSLTTKLAEILGEPLARRICAWMQGDEVNRLVKLLESEHPAARKMLSQPGVLLELWHYAETGDLRHEQLLRALRPITKDAAQAAHLAEAIRTTQWRAVRDDRQMHFDMLRAQSEMRAERATEQDELMAQINAAVTRLGRRLPAVRNLPAEASFPAHRGARRERHRAFSRSGPPQWHGKLRTRSA